MKATVQILLNSNRVDYPAKDGRKANAKHTCQCFILSGAEQQVAVLSVYDNVAESVTQEFEVEGKKVKLIPAGAYELEFGLVRGWDDKEIKGGLKSITPIGAGSPVLANLAQTGKAAKQ